MSEQGPALSVHDLSVRFTAREGDVTAVNGVSFDLARGEVLGILGESGSGKSVTLRALIGLLPPRRTVIGGTIAFDGRDMAADQTTRLAELRGRKIAMIFQEPMLALDPVFTIGDQIAEAIVRHEAVSWAAAWARAQELLELVQIPSAARRLRNYPHEMSGGMRQRAMIALALSCRPEVLLADEPTTALDVTVQIQIVLLLRALQRELGMAVIFVTHDVGVAVEIADRLAVMYSGRIVEAGTTAEVIAAPKHPYTAGLLGSSVRHARKGVPLRTIPGLPPDLRRLPPGCSFAPRCGHMAMACQQTMPALTALPDGHLSRCRRVVEEGLDPR
ncbi:MAG: ABC transporter ATP-binding protein [Alphaproteobacteria bacterium]|nr:ABC transporter ATP-binding protein [Alphaproteobacteria bacterium]